MAIERRKRSGRAESGEQSEQTPVVSRTRRRGTQAESAAITDKKDKKSKKKNKAEKNAFIKSGKKGKAVNETVSARQEEARRVAMEREAVLEKRQKEMLRADDRDLRRYQGYDVSSFEQRQENKPKRWFWKILMVSLILSMIIIAVMVLFTLLFNKKQTDYISSINESNTLDKLMEDKKLIQITRTYLNTADGNDYTSVRQIRKDKNGDYFTYHKTVDSDDDYKEIIGKGNLYRNDDNYTYFYGMIGDEYEKRLQEMEEEVITISADEKVVQQSEGGGIVNVKTRYEVQPGDFYTEKFGCNPGEIIDRSITLDPVTSQVTQDTEMYNDQEIFIYKMESDVQIKTPNFYQKVLKTTTNRKCVVYYDYGGDDQKAYKYDVPTDVYFTLFKHEGFEVYMDRDKTTLFSDFEMQSQNPESALTLYMMKTEQ